MKVKYLRITENKAIAHDCLFEEIWSCTEINPRELKSNKNILKHNIELSIMISLEALGNNRSFN